MTKNRNKIYIYASKTFLVIIIKNKNNDNFVNDKKITKSCAKVKKKQKKMYFNKKVMN